MENASKALLMAGGILIGVLILALMVTLFISSQDITKSYEETKQSEAVQQFNVNFTKYIGQNLTIHQVVTICNFAIENGIKKENISEFKTKDNISNDEAKYTLTINSYSDEGYVNSISFSKVN